jgi:hypothetical protein
MSNQTKYTSVKLSFDNSSDYYKAQTTLYNNGFKRPTSPDCGNGYYESNDGWHTISFNKSIESDILNLLKGINFEIKYLLIIEYKVFNQGGYLD